MLLFIGRHFHSIPKTITMKSRFDNERTKRTTTKFSSLKMKLDCSEQRRSSYWLRMDGERKWTQTVARVRQEQRSSASFSRSLESMQTIRHWDPSKLTTQTSIFRLVEHFRRTLRAEILRRKPQKCFLSLFIIYLCDEKRRYRVFNPPWKYFLLQLRHERGERISIVFEGILMNRGSLRENKFQNW